MPDERITPQPQEGKNVEENENTKELNNEEFESDTQKIIRRHLENKDDIITDEDIANIRVGMVPPEFNRATEANFELDEDREEAEDNLSGGTNDTDKDKKLDEGQITSLNSINPAR